MEIPTQRRFSPGEFLMSPSANQSTNQEVQSPAAIKSMSIIGIFATTAFPVAMLVFFYWIAGSFHPAIFPLPVIIFIVQLPQLKNDMMLHISGNFVADRTREDEHEVRMEFARLSEKEMDLHYQLQMAKLNNDSQERIQELINDQRVLKLQMHNNHLKARAIVHQSHQQHPQAAQHPHADDNQQIDVFVPQLKEKFLEWLETAYNECDGQGYPTGKEPWSAKGAWGEKESAAFKADVLPRLKMVDPPIIMQSKRHTGNRVRLNLQEFPTFSDAENVVWQIL